jgi:glycyl-tRNA synthetase beta chain
VKPALFVSPVENSLWDSWSQQAVHIHASLANKRYRETFEGLAKIGVQLAAFFDKGGVMVMDPKPELRENRLALLHAIYDPFVKIGDFRKLGGAS